MKNIDAVTAQGLDEFCSRFIRPVSLLSERRIDTGKLRAHFAQNLKNSILKGRTAAYQFYQRNKPVSLTNVMEEELAAKTARIENKIFKIMDLIVPERERNPDVERKMLKDIPERMEDHVMMEYRVDASNTGSIRRAEKAGFHLSTGAAFHLNR